MHNNAIGNMGAKMLLNALEYRKLSKRKPGQPTEFWTSLKLDFVLEEKLGSVGVRVSEKIDKDLFTAIIKASKKIKKKKMKKKKKVFSNTLDLHLELQEPHDLVF